MARYSSDSDDDRRSREKRSKRSRKRDRRSRSRSRDRRRRSRSRSRSSRSHRRRSRSRSGDRRSSDDYYRPKKSRRDRDRRSRSPSSSRTSEERQKDKRDKDVAVEKTKQRIKEALNQAETNDDDLLKAKEKKKLGKEVIPNADAIAEIESNEFVQQSFSSSSKDKPVVDKSQPETWLSSIKPTTVVPVNFSMNSSNSEGLFAARVLEDESIKMERWIKKLTATRNKMLAAGSFKQ